MRKMRAQAGFTILELLIAMTILAFIALGIYQTTTSSFTLRENLTRDGDFYNTIRVCMDLIGRDISHMFNPQAEAMPGEMGKAPATDPNNPKARAPQIQDNRVLPFWGPKINQSGVRGGRIRGKENELSFIANNHVRLFKDAPETDFVKVTYKLQADALAKSTEGQQLVRFEDTDAFTERDNEEKKVIYPLIDKVKSLTFEYLNGEKDRFDKTWDNYEGIDANGKFPDAVKVRLEVYMPQQPGSPPSENTFAVEQIYRPELAL